jgi:hypothetical protein
VFQIAGDIVKAFRDDQRHSPILNLNMNLP